MKELFSRIESDLQIEPSSKIVPAKTFATWITADEMLDDVKREIDLFREKAKREAAELRAAEEQKGFKEGLDKWAKQIASLEKSQKDLRDDMRKQIVELVIQCGKKILGRELELSQDAIVDIVSQALRPVATHKHATIYVCKEDAEALEANKKQLHTVLEGTETLAIGVRSDIERGGCVIETEAGIINAKIDVLWESLELALLGLLKNDE